jgi:hypothetical protein
LPALTAAVGLGLFPQIPEKEALLNKIEKTLPESSTTWNSKPWWWWWGWLSWKADSPRVPDNHSHYLGSPLQVKKKGPFVLTR